MPQSENTRELLCALHALIERYQTSDPDLTAELKAYRIKLEEALKQRDRRDAVRLGLQIAGWIKFLADFWPD
jgi:hypothetical protein